MKKKTIISLLTFIAVGGIILGFTVFNSNKNYGIQYKTEMIDKGNIEALVITTGSLTPVNIVDIGSQVSGKIEKLNVDFNSEVKEGQIIAELEKTSFLIRVQQNEANYQSAQARLEKEKVTLGSKKKKYDRSLELFEKNLISYEEKESAETQYLSARTDLQSAESGLKQAKSQLDSSKVDLAYTIIKSPIDGIIINRNINKGQTVAASFQAPVLFQIANDLSKMQVECDVDEADIGKIKEGQKVRFTVDAFPDESFTGKMSQVRYSPEIIQNVVTYTTIVEVENPDKKLMPGMTATVSVIIGEAKNKLLVPNSALRFTPQLSSDEMKTIYEDMRKERDKSGALQVNGPTEGNHEKKSSQSRTQFSNKTGQGRQEDLRKNASRVWIMDGNGKIKPVTIKTGVTDNSYTEVTGGNLKEGQKVITAVQSGSEKSKSSQDSNSMREMMRMMR